MNIFDWERRPKNGALMEKAANANRNIFLLIPVEFPVFWDRLDRGVKTS